MSPSHLAPLALAWPEPWAWWAAQGQMPPLRKGPDGRGGGGGGTHTLLKRQGKRKLSR